MPKLIIHRGSEWMNKYRLIHIILDNVEIGTIANTQTKEFTISAGKHRMEARIDGCGSIPITFQLDVDLDVDGTDHAYLKGHGFEKTTLLLSTPYRRFCSGIND